MVRGVGRAAPHLPLEEAAFVVDAVGCRHDQRVMEGISMRSQAFRRRVPAFVLLLTAMITVMAIPLAVAQAPGSPPAQSAQTTMTDTSDDSSGEWGLLGLVGLLGLAGLMRRDRTRLSDRPLDRTTERERVGRP